MLLLGIKARRTAAVLVDNIGCDVSLLEEIRVLLEGTGVLVLGRFRENDALIQRSETGNEDYTEDEPPHT